MTSLTKTEIQDKSMWGREEREVKKTHGFEVEVTKRHIRTDA